MFKIFSLFGEVELKDQAAQKGLDEIDKKGEGIGKRFGGMATTVAKWGAAVAAGAVAAGVGALALVTKTAETTDRVDKLSQKIGLSRQGFQEWDFIMSQSGGSVEGLQMGFKTLVMRMDEAVTGTGEGAEAFGKLKISATDVNGAMKDQETMFNEAVIALQNMEEGSEKAKLANDLFGRSGAEMMPLLNGAAGSIDEMKLKANELGLVLSDDAVDAGVKFTDTMDQMKRMGGALFTQIGTEIMPVFQKMMDWIIAHMPEIKATFKAAFDAIGDTISFVVEWIKKIIDWFKNMQGDGESSVGGLVESVKLLFDGLIEFVQEWIALFMLFWSKYGEDIMKVLKTAWDLIVAILKTAITLITDIFKVFAALFKGDWEGLWEAVKDLFGNLIKGIVDILEKAFKLIIEYGKLYLGMLWDVVKDIFGGIAKSISGVWDGVVEKIAQAIDKIRQKIQGVMDFFSSVKDTVSNFVSGAKDKISGALSWIPGLATGGTIEESGRVLVGESGPEFLELPKGATVRPLDHPSDSGPREANIYIELDGRTLARALGAPLIDAIRVKTGLRV